MAIVKATYTKSGQVAKTSIRYMQHRPGREGEKTTRHLFNSDGLMGRWQAYKMIDEAEQGSFFYRFALSPDPKQEDTKRDLLLREITEQTMLRLEDRLQTHIQWVAAMHDDHAPHRHVHILAIVQERLQVQDFQAMRQEATKDCREQRQQRDLILAHERQKGEEAGWELQR